MRPAVAAAMRFRRRRLRSSALDPGLERYWSVDAATVLARLSASSGGLTSREAADRLRVLHSAVTSSFTRRPS